MRIWTLTLTMYLQHTRLGRTDVPFGEKTLTTQPLKWSISSSKITYNANLAYILHFFEYGLKSFGEHVVKLLGGTP